MYINTYIYILNKLNHFGVYLKLIHFKSTALQFKYLQKKINETVHKKKKDQKEICPSDSQNCLKTSVNSVQ